MATSLACSGDSPSPADVGPDGDSMTPTRLVIDHITAIDGRHGDRVVQVVIQGERIVAVNPPGSPVEGLATVIDGGGKFLVFGLVDAHVHLSLPGATTWTGDPLQQNLRASLYHGVTAVMDVGADESIIAVRDAISAGRMVGPRLKVTGPFLTARGSHPCEAYPYPLCIFVTEANAAAAARRLASLGVDALKVALADAAFTPWPTPRLDTTALSLIAGVELPVLAHVDTNADTVDAINAGVDVLAHPVFASPLDDAALQAAKKARAVHTTLGALAAGPDLVDGRLDLDDPHLIVGPNVISNWRTIRDDPSLLREGWLASSRSWWKNANANVAAMRAANVNLIPASDAGYLFIPHGLGLHRELDRLAKAGWTPRQLLAAVTIAARELLGMDGGVIESGAPADLLILTRDPLEDIAALKSIETVVLRGTPYARATLPGLDLLPSGHEAERSAGGGICLESADCRKGYICNGLLHRCKPACSGPHEPINDCGADAWCMPEQGLGLAGEGVCQPENNRCDVLRPGSCADHGYLMGCHPLDLDTAACRLAGAAQAGDPCTIVSEGSSCAPGLYCSPFEYVCYQFCDIGDNACPPHTTCRLQSASHLNWFGLCL